MLKLEKVTMEYADPLFKDVGFVLGNGEKVGLVGFNGTGKTTLLRIIAGLEIPTSGNVEIVNENLQYLPQVFDITENGKFEFIGEYLEYLVDDIHSEIWKVDRLLGILEFGDYDPFDLISVQSPGRKMKLYLTKLLMREPTFLLLDEPTNHLDILGIEWFEKFVRRFNGVCIIISHDREFLNQTTNRIFEIDEQALHIYDGNYDAYLDEKASRLEQRETLYGLQEKKRKRFEESIALFKKQADGEAQARKLKAMRTRMEREITKNEITQYQRKKIEKLSITGSVHRKKRILHLNEVSFGYSKDTRILKNCSLDIFGAEKVWIKGANGTGKSTLIKLLIGDLKPEDGAIRWGENIALSYFSQEQERFESDETVHEYFFKHTDMRWEQSYGVLDRFLFDHNLRDMRIKSLSPGQRSRLTFAIFAQKEFECLILDEPTNHLDIETKQSIETALREFKGAIILVSHDRYFARSIGPTRVLDMEEGRLVGKF